MAKKKAPTANRINQEEMVVRLDQVPRVQSPGFVSAYANNTNLATGFFDVRLIFSEILFSPGQDPKVVMEDRAAVTMSWEHAKAVLRLLQRKIDEYEKDNQAVIREQSASVATDAPQITE